MDLHFNDEWVGGECLDGDFRRDEESDGGVVSAGQRHVEQPDIWHRHVQQVAGQVPVVLQGRHQLQGLGKKGPSKNGEKSYQNAKSRPYSAICESV